MNKSFAVSIRLALVISLFGDPAALSAAALASSGRSPIAQASNNSLFRTDALASVDTWVAVSQAAERSGRGIVNRAVRALRRSSSQAFGLCMMPLLKVSAEQVRRILGGHAREMTTREIFNVLLQRIDRARDMADLEAEEEARNALIKFIVETVPELEDSHPFMTVLVQGAEAALIALKPFEKLQPAEFQTAIVSFLKTQMPPDGQATYFDQGSRLFLESHPSAVDGTNLLHYLMTRALRSSKIVFWFSRLRRQAINSPLIMSVDAIAAGLAEGVARGLNQFGADHWQENQPSILNEHGRPAAVRRHQQLNREHLPAGGWLGMMASQMVSWKLRETKIDPRVEAAIANMVKNVENERDWNRVREQVFSRAHDPAQFRLIVEGLALSMVYPRIDVGERASNAIWELMQEPQIGSMSVELPGEEGGPVMAMEWAYFYVLIVLRLDWGEEMSIGQAFSEYWQKETVANDPARVSVRKIRGRDLLADLTRTARSGGYAGELSARIADFYDILFKRDEVFDDDPDHPKVQNVFNGLRRDLEKSDDRTLDRKSAQQDAAASDAYARPLDANFMLRQWEVRAWTPIPSRNWRNRKVRLTLGTPGIAFQFDSDVNAEDLVRYGLSLPQADAMIAYIFKNGAESVDASDPLEEHLADSDEAPARSLETAEALRPIQPKDRLKFRPAEVAGRRLPAQEGELLGLRYFPAVGGRPEELELLIQIVKPTPHQATRRFSLEQLIAAEIATPLQAQLSFADARARDMPGGAFDAEIYADAYLGLLAQEAPASDELLQASDGLEMTEPFAKSGPLPVRAERAGNHLASIEIPVWKVELQDFRWIRVSDEMVKRHEPALLERWYRFDLSQESVDDAVLPELPDDRLRVFKRVLGGLARQLLTLPGEAFQRKDLRAGIISHFSNTREMLPLADWIKITRTKVNLAVQKMAEAGIAPTLTRLAVLLNATHEALRIQPPEFHEWLEGLGVKKANLEPFVDDGPHRAGLRRAVEFLKQNALPHGLVEVFRFAGFRNPDSRWIDENSEWLSAIGVDLASVLAEIRLRHLTGMTKSEFSVLGQSLEEMQTLVGATCFSTGDDGVLAFYQIYSHPEGNPQRQPAGYVSLRLNAESCVITQSTRQPDVNPPAPLRALLAAARKRYKPSLRAENRPAFDIADFSRPDRLTQAKEFSEMFGQTAAQADREKHLAEFLQTHAGFTAEDLLGLMQELGSKWAPALQDLVRASKLERLLGRPYEEANRSLEALGAKLRVDWIGRLDRPLVTVAAKSADEATAFVILTETSAGQSALFSAGLAVWKALMDFFAFLRERENSRAETMPEGARINIARLAAMAVIEEDEQYGLAEWQDVPRRIAARRSIMQKYRAISRFHEDDFHAVLAMWTPVPARRTVVFRGDSPDAADGRRLRAVTRLQAALSRPDLTNEKGGLDITKIFKIAGQNTEDRVANGARDELQTLYEPIREGKPPLFSATDRRRFTRDGLWSSTVAQFIDALQKRNIVEKAQERQAAATKRPMTQDRRKAAALAAAALEKAVDYFFTKYKGQVKYDTLARIVAEGAAKFRVDAEAVVGQLQQSGIRITYVRGILEALRALPKTLPGRNSRSA